MYLFTLLLRCTVLAFESTCRYSFLQARSGSLEVTAHLSDLLFGTFIAMLLQRRSASLSCLPEGNNKGLSSIKVSGIAKLQPEVCTAC